MSEEIVPELLSSCSDDWVCCCLIDAHCNYCDTQSETHPLPDHKLGQSDTVLINTSIMYNEKILIIKLRAATVSMGTALAFQI